MLNMKKTVLALGGVLMFFATALRAQDQPFSFGLRGGGSNSLIMGLGDKKFGENSAESSSFNLFFTAGVHAGYAFHEYMGVGIGVDYCNVSAEAKEVLKKGEDNKDSKQQDKGVYFVSLHGITAPVAFRIFPMGYDPQEGIFSIYLGPQISYFFNTTVENKREGGDSSKNQNDKKDSDFKEEYFNPFQIGAFGGLGYEFPDTGFSIEGRYSFLSFMSIFNDDKAKDYKEARGFKKNDALRGQLVTLGLSYDFAYLMS